MLPTYVRAASAARGAAAAAAALHKRGKYCNDIPGYAFFLPLAFETEGYHTNDLDKLLYGFAMKRATAHGWDGAAANNPRVPACWISADWRCAARFCPSCRHVRHVRPSCRPDAPRRAMMERQQFQAGPTRGRWCLELPMRLVQLIPNILAL